MHRGAINTVLTFADGSKKTVNVAIFKRDLAVMRKTQSLIGKGVKTTSWDPVNDQGKWFRQGYFRNICEVEHRK